MVDIMVRIWFKSQYNGAVRVLSPARCACALFLISDSSCLRGFGNIYNTHLYLEGQIWRLDPIRQPMGDQSSGIVPAEFYDALGGQ